MKRKLLAALIAACFNPGLAQAIVLDKNLQFDAGATLVTVTAPSTNVIDLINARDMALGDKFAMKASVTLTTTFLAAGAGTLRIQFQGSVDNVTWTTYSQTDDIPKASLLAGKQIELPLAAMPPQALGLPRYLRLNYIVTTGPFTAGALEADLVVAGDQDNNPPTYPPGVVVSN